MSILDRIAKIKDEAPRITLYGKPGIGKSTLAAQFPSPLFILTEKNGVTGVDSTPIVTEFRTLWDDLTELSQIESIPYKTIIIDSVTKLDVLITNHILKDEKKGATLATAGGGYGAGMMRSESIHRAFKGLLDGFQSKGITIIYICHLTTVKFKSPDTDDYDTYNIEMACNRARSVYLDDVDFVGFCKLNSFVSEDSKSKRSKVVSGSRVIITNSSDTHISKNRFGIPGEIPMTYSDIAKYIPFLKGE